ncbi:MAG: phosphoribosylamine--glycine ligase [Gemmatimonadetes bacterium]|nr:phosphoribosylamine--glycine ligase [Gemmatimonadota bacterium]
MKILIVGNGGREHALLWKLRRDAPSAEFFITGGNAGTEALARSLPIGAGDIDALASWAADERVDLTVVGPEVPLARGIVDRFRVRSLPVFGPDARAARIESSKVFAKRLFERYDIPTAKFRAFTEIEAAGTYVLEHGAPIVVKASGLAAGKGAVVCMTVPEALAALDEMLGQQTFGEAGSEVVIEEFMSGEELSVFALCDVERAIPMLPAQDHKRVGEGDTGPNTGGMGAYAPVSISTDALLREITETILNPTLSALAQEGSPFHGLLYAGLMLTPEGPKVIEYNCRFGDPETQALLPLIESSLLDPMLAIANGDGLDDWAESGLRWRAGAAVTTVLASAGYPGAYETGAAITIPSGLEEADDLVVFHAGTVSRDGAVLSTGGRVLAVTGLGADVALAAARSRDAASSIQFAGAQFRRDIAWREIARNR